MRELIKFVVHDFMDFVLHQKKWWITALLIIIGVFIAVALFNEPRAVRPIIYTDY